MQELGLSEGPEYLSDGALHKLMLENIEDPNEVLSFETKVLKQNTNVESTGDCDHFMNSLRFWGVTKICDEISTIVLSNPSEGNDKVLAKYEEKRPYPRALRMIEKAYFNQMKSGGQLTCCEERDSSPDRCMHT